MPNKSLKSTQIFTVTDNTKPTFLTRPADLLIYKRVLVLHDATVAITEM
jgi:hypothetical protein